MLSFNRFTVFAVLCAVTVSCGQEDQSALNAVSESGYQNDFSKRSATPFWDVSKSDDSSLNRSNVFYPYFVAAAQKGLPTNFLRELIQVNADVSIEYRDWPAYQPGWLFGKDKLYTPHKNTPPSQYGAFEWGRFYNELFHAWWSKVFLKSEKYRTARAYFFSAQQLQNMKRANPRDPKLALEEGISETVHGLMSYFALRAPGDKPYLALEFFVYNKNKTVAAVSHSDRSGGYTPASENTYLSPEQYAYFFEVMTGKQPPQPTQMQN